MTTATQPITLAPLGVDPALLDQVAATASAVDKGEVDARFHCWAMPGFSTPTCSPLHASFANSPATTSPWDSPPGPTA